MRIGHYVPKLKNYNMYFENFGNRQFKFEGSTELFNDLQQTSQSCFLLNGFHEMFDPIHDNKGLKKAGDVQRKLLNG